jgi:hypothetical protein
MIFVAVSSDIANALFSSIFSSEILDDVPSMFFAKCISDVFRRFREPIHFFFIWKTHSVLVLFYLFVELLHLVSWIIEVPQAFYPIVCATTLVSNKLLVSINNHFVPVTFTTHYVGSNFSFLYHYLIFMEGIVTKRIRFNSLDWFHTLKLIFIFIQIFFLTFSIRVHNSQICIYLWIDFLLLLDNFFDVVCKVALLLFIQFSTYLLLYYCRILIFFFIRKFFLFLFLFRSFLF